MHNQQQTPAPGLPNHPNHRAPLEPGDFPRPPPVDLLGKVLDFFLNAITPKVPQPSLGSILIVELWTPEHSIGIVGPPLPDIVESILLGPWLGGGRELPWSKTFEAGGYRDASGPMTPPLAADDYPVDHAWRSFTGLWTRAASGKARVTSWPLGFSGPKVIIRDLWGRRHEIQGNDHVDPFALEVGEQWLGRALAVLDLLD